jgi:Xaa-Pro aminopeptidase
MAIFDLTAIYRGYCCDLCRSFAVDGRPKSAQREAYCLITDVFAFIEATVKPGKSCRKLYEEVHGMLDGRQGWRFPHHLGHGIGLNPHEAPRLNPNWDDVFQPGDTFTAEPGLYDEDLKGGIRIEHNYLVTEDGLERLSHFPTDI